MMDAPSGQRWLSAQDTATYVGLRPAAFQRRVATGILPQPSHVLGGSSWRWDRLAIDARMLEKESLVDVHAACEQVADEIRARGAARKAKA